MPELVDALLLIHIQNDFCSGESLPIPEKQRGKQISNALPGLQQIRVSKFSISLKP